MNASHCKAICITMLSIIFTIGHSQSVSINNDGSAPHASALLDVKSTTKGILMPRMDKSQRSFISSPATGLLIYTDWRKETIL